MWDLSSLTRDQTRVLCIGMWILNYWTTGEVPGIFLKSFGQMFSMWPKKYCMCPVAASSLLPWTAARQASLSFTISQILLKFISIESVMLSNHLILCSPLVLLPSIFPSIRVFSNELALHMRYLKCWNFSISPSNECSRLISFSIDWFDLLADQETLESFPSTTVWKHQFFSTQPSLWSNSHICTWPLEKP